MQKYNIRSNVSDNMLSRLLIILLSAVLTIVFHAGSMTPDENFYRQLLQSDVESLKKRGMQLVVSCPDSAIAYFSVVAARYNSEMPENEKRICVSSMNNLGYLHFFHNNDPILSYSYLVKGMSVAEDLDMKDIIANISLNMANIFCVLDDYDSAMMYYKKAIHLAAESEEYSTLLTSMSNMLALLYSAHPDRFDEIVPETNMFRAMKLPDLPMSDYTRSIMRGIEFSSKKDYASAEREFINSLKQINTVYTPERFRLQSYSLLATLEYIRGNNPKAVFWLKKSLNESGAPDIRASIYYRLRQCYERLGRADSAAYYASRYITLSDTMLLSGQAKTLRDIETQVSTAALNEKIAKGVSERRNMTTVIIILLVALAVMTILGIWLWISRNRLRKANEELYRHTREKASRPIMEQTVETTESTPESADPCTNGSLADTLLKIMESHDDIYQPDFSLDSLARLAGVSTRKVSQVINSQFGTNFNTFLQEYRVREACRRLDDKEHFGSMTIEAISESLGFKSRSNFVAVFKKFTGLTPSSYQKIGKRH